MLIFIMTTANYAKTSKKNTLERKLNEVNNLYNKFYNIQKREKEIKYLKQIINILVKLTEKYPKNEQLFWKTAEAYYRLAEKSNNNKIKILKKGKQYAEQSISLNKKCGKAYFWKAAINGQIAQNQGVLKSVSMIKPMRNWAKKAIKYEPNYSPAYHLLAKIYFKAPGWPISIGDDEKALKYRKKSVNLAPNNIEYRWELYRNYRKLNKENKAKKVLKEILEMKPEGNSKKENKILSRAKNEIKKYK